MQIYHVETQEDYDALMDLNSRRGIWWADDTEPKEFNFWAEFRNETCVMIKDDEMYYGLKLEYIETYPDIPIQKYKAKSPGTKMQEGVSKLARAMKQNDPVNNPSHYTQGELEVIDILQDKLTPQEFEGFLKGNILKYTFREGIKNGTEDMKKGAWYMSRLIDFRKKQEG